MKDSENGKEHRIRALISAIEAALDHPERQIVHGAQSGVDAALARLRTTDRSTGGDRASNAFTDLPPQGSRHSAVLDQAIAGIGSGPGLAEIKACLLAAKDDLVWNEDQGRYYDADAALSESYKACNLHSLLIGPTGCGFVHEDFLLGLFMLGPDTFYSDHHHAAPEVYLNLSNRTGWRFDGGPWQDHAPGTLLHNAPHEVHATRVYEVPFLSVFVWERDVGVKSLTTTPE